ncbi:hypothetical protein CWE11_06905 [Aliidiomarina sanyensis]|uniref:Uncharacterized protein n=1 Tax=Aliidiomarina sanyensis TaxID=1249555 RepID=A0A432WG05_9GAMM|nr:hypothetical protein CWE11_06905 [Aliidiomarina sanyensis]
METFTLFCGTDRPAQTRVQKTARAYHSPHIFSSTNTSGARIGDDGSQRTALGARGWKRRLRRVMIVANAQRWERWLKATPSPGDDRSQRTALGTMVESDAFAE